MDIHAVASAYNPNHPLYTGTLIPQDKLYKLLGSENVVDKWLAIIAQFDRDYVEAMVNNDEVYLSRLTEEAKNELEVLFKENPSHFIALITSREEKSLLLKPIHNGDNELYKLGQLGYEEGFPTVMRWLLKEYERDVSAGRDRRNLKNFNAAKHIYGFTENPYNFYRPDPDSLELALRRESGIHHDRSAKSHALIEWFDYVKNVLSRDPVRESLAHDAGVSLVKRAEEDIKALEGAASDGAYPQKSSSVKQENQNGEV